MNKFAAFSRNFKIGNKNVGLDASPFVIAELSGNHKGSIGKALAMIDAAADAGANAVKIQTFTADTITMQHDGPDFRIEGGLWAGRTLYDLYQEAHTPWEWHPALFAKAQSRDITMFSSPFDASAIRLLESLGCPAYKIASFENNDIGLIKQATSTGRPLIISTGLATLAEIEESVMTVLLSGGTQLALLHCISGYPTPIEDCNLRTIVDLAQRFGVPVGLSDHTIDNTASVTAVALGATVIEKHFTLDRNDGAVDAAFSLEPDQFSAMVQEIRKVHLALGKVNYDLKPSETGGRAFRRSLYVTQDISAGECFSEHNLRSIRPGLGLHTRYLSQILGCRARVDISRGTALAKEHVDVELKEAD